MKKLLSLLACTLLLATAPGLAQTTEDEIYSKAFAKMLEVSGAQANFEAATKQMLAMFQTQMGEEAEEFLESFEAEMMAAGIAALIPMLEPVYKKHLTLGDLEALIQFYSTPVGVKYAQASPLITQESMQVGQQWGMEMGQKIIEEMDKRKD